MSLFRGSRTRLVSVTRPVAVGFIAAVVAVTVVATLAVDTAEGAATTLSQQLSDIRADLSDVRANLKKAEAARKSALGDLAALDQSVEYAQRAYNKAHSAYKTAAAELSGLQEQLNELVVQLEDNERELRQTQIDLSRQQDVLCDRMVGIYKSGGSLSYIAALLGDDSVSLSEVADGFSLLSAIAEQDADILSQIRVLKGTILEQRQELEVEHNRVITLQEAQAAVTAELQAADRECKAALVEVEAARTAKKAALKAIEKDQARWTRQEDQLQADSDRVAALLKKSGSTVTTKAGKGVLSWPVPGPVTSNFGYRIHPIFKVKKLHTGIDLRAAMGDPIKAAAAGTVVQAGWRGGYGKCVVIDHGGGLATLYAHQSTILVSVGQVVKRGQVIGKIGSTGYSTGAHLHFEVRVNGTPVDPLGYL